MALQISSFSHMPEEDIVYIFSHLNASSLGTCCQVNHDFHRIATHEALWKALFHRIQVPFEINLENLRKHCILSSKALERRFVELLKELPLTGEGEIQMVYGYDPSVKLTARYSFLTPKEYSIVERYLLGNVTKQYYLVANPYECGIPHQDDRTGSSSGHTQLRWANEGGWVEIKASNLPIRIERNFLQIMRSHDRENIRKAKELHYYYGTAAAVAGISIATQAFLG